MVGALLAGCSGTVKADPTGRDVESISVMASQDWVRDPELALAKKFEKETGIKVDYQIIPADQYSNVLSTKLNSGDAADIFMNQSGKFDIVSQLQIEKNGVDLTDQDWVSRMEPARRIRSASTARSTARPSGTLPTRGPTSTTRRSSTASASSRRPRSRSS